MNPAELTVGVEARRVHRVAHASAWADARGQGRRRSRADRGWLLDDRAEQADMVMAARHGFRSCAGAVLRFDSTRAGTAPTNRSHAGNAARLRV